MARQALSDEIWGQLRKKCWTEAAALLGAVEPAACVSAVAEIFLPL
jgi:hypothetical protein